MTKPKRKIQWALNSAHIPSLWADTRGEGVRVAILDTGVAWGHPDLKDISVYSWFNSTDRSGAADCVGHGTHCAGVVRQVAPACELIIGKVTDDFAEAYQGALADGIRWAIEHEADIISVSLGWATGTDELQAACREAVAAKSWIIAAAGNSGPIPGFTDYPGAYDEVISVGSIGRWPHIVNTWSSRGSTLDVVAPGDKVWSCWPPDTYKRLSGTSMACPFVAGVLALAISKHRRLGGDTPIQTLDDVIAHLCKTAVDRGSKGPDKVHGWGIVDPRKAVE